MGGLNDNIVIYRWCVMDYFVSYIDSDGYIYSIDNVVIEYKLGIGTSNSFLKSIKELSEKYPDNNKEYWERLNCPLCSKYQYYEHHIHLRDGIYLMIGKWFLFDKDKDRVLFPMVKLDVNPNKHYKDDIFLDLIKIIREDMADYYLKRFDFAIDIKTDLENVQNFSSRKEKGLYKGTRYYGIHNQNGFCKIYDKKKESNLDYSLTRVEHTIKISEKKQSIKDIVQNLNLEKIMVKKEINQSLKLNRSASALRDFYIRCKVNNIEVDDIMDNLDYRMKKQIFEAVSECDYKLINYDIEIIKRLIKKVIELYCPEKAIIEDDNGFLQTNKDLYLPFD